MYININKYKIMEFYFLEIVKEKSLKVKPVSGQKLTDGSSIDSALSVQCPKIYRDKFKEGTILYTNGIKLAKSGKYYSVKELKVIDKTSSDVLDAYKKVTGKDFTFPIEYLYDEIVKDSKLEAPKSDKDGFFMTTADWSLLIRNIKRHVNTLILGPTGCGKTSCVKEVCSRLGIPLHVFDMGSIIDPISSLLGVHRLVKGESKFDYAKFTEVIQKPCVILLDEINRSSMGSNNILFPCLDDRRTLNIEIASGEGIREIKVHPEVTFIATANIGSEYTGTMMMDRALTNRFFPLELGHIPNDEEIKVLNKRTGISIDKAETLVKITNNIRSMADKTELSTGVSIRETLMVSSLVSDGWSLNDAMEMIYLPLFEGSKTSGERSTVYKLMLSYGG